MPRSLGRRGCPDRSRASPNIPLNVPQRRPRFRTTTSLLDVNRMSKLAWLWRKLLLAIALTPLTGAGFGSSLLPDDNLAAGEVLATADMQRGRLLYETHCVACHTTQAHWRDKHIVRSWADLLYQVARMQKNAGQDWSSSEIGDVAAYLNEQFYKMPCPTQGCEGPQANARTPTGFSAQTRTGGSSN